MRINIQSIPHHKQRYDTCGDYWTDKCGVLQVRVSNMCNWKYGWIVLLHELVEIFLCKVQGVSFEDIDKFDFKYVPKSATDEPGDNREAPYARQHCMAMAVDRMLCAYTGIFWLDYEESFLHPESGPEVKNREMIYAVE